MKAMDLPPKPNPSVTLTWVGRPKLLPFQSVERESKRTYTQKAKKVADNIRKLKNKPFEFKDENGNEFPEWEEKTLEDIARRVTRKNKIGNINIILHIAASSHVTRSVQYPLEFVYDNVVGTANLLEYARTLPNLERMIHFSTDEVFGSSIGEYKFKEYDRYNSTNPYSASKAAAEEICVAVVPM